MIGGQPFQAAAGLMPGVAIPAEISPAASKGLPRPSRRVPIVLKSYYAG
jgi:hypothetical protein